MTVAPDTKNAREGYVDAKAVAAFLSVDVGWVYAHADELDAKRLGTGPKARLRFDLEYVKRTLSCSAGRASNEPVMALQQAPRTRRRRATGRSVDLLPIRGQKAA